MIPVPCPLCKETSFKPLFSCRDHFDVGSKKEYELVTCDNCGLVYVNPQPGVGELLECYGLRYREFHDAWKSSPLLSMLSRRQIKRRLKSLETNKRIGKLLDVGCGRGDFLLQARQSGWTVFGTEISSVEAEIAARNSGAEVLVGDIEDCDFENNSFDAVTMWHVFEHLRFPLAALQKAYRLLKTGGLLIVELPDCSSWGAKLFKSSWVGYDVPRHLCNFSAELLKDTLARNGFDVIAVEHSSFTSFGISWSLRYYVDESVQSQKLKSVISVLVRNAITVGAIGAVASLIERFGKGMAVTIFAVKGNYREP